MKTWSRIVGQASSPALTGVSPANTLAGETPAEAAGTAALLTRNAGFIRQKCEGRGKLPTKVGVPGFAFLITIGAIFICSSILSRAEESDDPSAELASFQIADGFEV